MTATLIAKDLSAGHGDRVLFTGLDLIVAPGDVIGLVTSDGPGDVRLDEGRKFLTCPLHGWEFDVRTGQSYFDPKRIRARTFPVEVRAGAEVVEGRLPGPYTAETYAVSVEDDYVVVHTGRPRRA